MLNKDSSEQLLAASECCHCAAQKLGSKIQNWRQVVLQEHQGIRFYLNILTLDRFLQKSALKIEERSRRKGGGREKKQFYSHFTANQIWIFFLFNWDI